MPLLGEVKFEGEYRRTLGRKNFDPAAANRWRGESKKSPAIYFVASTHDTSTTRSIANMATEQPPAQPQADNADKTHTDPVTGEKISKSELKRRTKQREKDEKKKEKEAALPARPKKEKKDDAEELNPNQYFEIRSSKINALRASKQPNPYPHKFHVNYKLADYVRDYSHLTKGDTQPEKEVRIGLRVMTIRSASSSLRFYVCKAEGVTIQVMCQLQESKADVPFETQHENIQRGDIIGVVGFPGRTNPKKGGEGELSIFAREVILLTPCLRMLPTEHLYVATSHSRVNCGTNT